MFINQQHTSQIDVIEEPNLQDLLADPTTHLVMESDGVCQEELVDLLAVARRHLLRLPDRRALRLRRRNANQG